MTRFWCFSLITALVLCGCSGDGTEDNLPETVPAEGILLLDGEPVDGASIVFAPVSPGEHAASAVTGSDGDFQLQAFPVKDGAVPGSYQVGVTKMVAQNSGPAWNPADFGEDAAHAAESPPPTEWKNVLPEVYADPAGSGLTADIPADGTYELRIELQSNH